ncbi:MAG: Holliday junction branch migration protein RuvA [Deltaproteobacteria bacterium]|nr:MAG: Holliday junction branch migration protein RuvA [Deltaproteobacteria bacterium]
MIAALTGKVIRSAPGEVVVDVGGVGYRVHTSLATFSRIPGIGGEVSLRISTVVREDEISLYGFAAEEEEWFFTLLQGVSGVGPKLALKILSGIELARLRDGLSSGDTKLLTTISGVGKKMAERMVVELRDKVGAEMSVSSLSVVGHSVGGVSEAVDALLSLGYQQKVARQAVETVAASEEGPFPVEEMVRRALKTLAPKR